jgi:DNA-binding transcriptional MerR regulator
MVCLVSDETWTIAELCAEVATVLGRDYRGASNGQVRAVPDERGVRYYNTLGLLDRPLAMRGRTALYGRRHLAQVVAIKRMQEAGKSLAEIQATLPALGDRELAELAGVTVEPPRPAAPRAGFWREVPEISSSPAMSETRTSDDGDSIDGSPEPIARTSDPGFIARLELSLAPGVTLALAPDRDATDADADALRLAAAPLIAELLRRRLIASS